MNAERIKELADFLLQTDQKLKLQQRLEALRDALINLTSQPGEATYQTAVVSTMADLSKAVANQLEGQLTPARTEALREIGAGPYFSKAMTESIQVMLAENSVTPAAVRDAVTQLAEKRTAFLENLRKTQAGLLALGVQSEPLSPGEADLGFLLPRDLFKNSLSGFSKELTEIEKIINRIEAAIDYRPFDIPSGACRCRSCDWRDNNLASKHLEAGIGNTIFAR
jgi:hypothetical protein